MNLLLLVVMEDFYNQQPNLGDFQSEQKKMTMPSSSENIQPASLSQKPSVENLAQQQAQQAAIAQQQEDNRKAEAEANREKQHVLMSVPEDTPAFVFPDWWGQFDDECSDIGDINYDFSINILDIITLINYILENNNLDYQLLVVSDLNLDSIINILDIVLLTDIILGIN